MKAKALFSLFLLAAVFLLSGKAPEPQAEIQLKNLQRYNDIRAVTTIKDLKDKKIKEVAYMIGTIHSRMKKGAPEQPFHLFLSGFKPGLQVLSVIITFEDGSFVNDSIAIFFRSSPEENVAPFFLDRKALSAFMNELFQVYYQNRKLDLKAGAMANVLKKEFAWKVMGELNDVPATEKAMRQYLADLKEQNAIMEKFISANAEAYAAADKTWVNPSKQMLPSFLRKNGVNGRFYLNHITHGRREMRFNLESGIDFHFASPHNLRMVHLLGLEAQKNNAIVSAFLSRIPDPKHRKEFPKFRYRNHGDYTREEIRLLAQRFGTNLMFSIDEWGGQQDWALYAGPRIPQDRLDCEQLFIDSQREFLAYWLPKGTGVFAWDNLAVPGLQYEGGVDIFLTQVFRGHNMGITFASLRGDSKAYNKDFAVSVTELSWLAATLDWGITDGDNPDTFGGLAKATSIWAAIGRDYKPCYDDADIAKVYFYSFVSGARAIGHEAPGIHSAAYPFLKFMKKHPSMGFPMNRIAVVRGQGGGARIAPAGDDARATGHPAVYALDATAGRDKKGFNTLSDWGYNTHLRDYGLMNIFYPGFGNSYYTRKQFTAAPYGAVDLIYGRAPLSAKEYDFAMVISVNIMTKDQIAKWTKFMEDGGTLLINIEQCKGKERTFTPETLAFLEQVCGVKVGATLPERDCKLTAGKMVVPAPAMILTKVTPLEGTRTTVTDDAMNPVCVERNVGKGKVLLTLSQWHWRIPMEVTAKLVKEATAKIPLYVKPVENADSMEFFANRLLDNSGIVVSVFNHKVDHTVVQHFRKIYRTEKKVLPGTVKKKYHISLPDDEDKAIAFAFPEGLDFRKYDEFLMTARIDGRKPGGSCNFIFTDNVGKKRTWKYGQILVGRMLGSEGEFFTRWMSPAHKNYSNVASLVGDKDFNWKDVRKIEITFNRCENNSALDFNFHLEELALQNLYWKEKMKYKRLHLPFESAVEVNCEAMGIDAGKIKAVYACGGNWEPEKISFQRKNGKIIFKGFLNDDFGEYLLSFNELAEKK
ncbi:MAG: hypothetical protein IKB16_15015 [Lentisphaeria bacterium]|nr:hypothetical protein [Lentisphaeria bacterium]